MKDVYCDFSNGPTLVLHNSSNILGRFFSNIKRMLLFLNNCAKVRISVCLSALVWNSIDQTNIALLLLILLHHIQHQQLKICLGHQFWLVGNICRAGLGHLIGVGPTSPPPAGGWPVAVAAGLAGFPWRRRQPSAAVPTKPKLI